jgi:hypothetical protein
MEIFFGDHYSHRQTIDVYQYSDSLILIADYIIVVDSVEGLMTT